MVAFSAIELDATNPTGRIVPSEAEADILAHFITRCLQKHRPTAARTFAPPVIARDILPVVGATGDPRRGRLINLGIFECGEAVKLSEAFADYFKANRAKLTGWAHGYLAHRSARARVYYAQIQAGRTAQPA